MTRYIPNASEDPTYIGHKVIKGGGFIYSIPVYSDSKKNVKADQFLAGKTYTEELIDKKDLKDYEPGKPLKAKK